MHHRILLASLSVLVAWPLAAQDPPVIAGPGTIYYVADEGPMWDALQARGEGTLRVLYVPAEGFAYEDEEGRLTGVTVEVMRDFAAWVEEEHGVAVHLNFVEEQDWRRFYDRVRSGTGGLFGLGNVTITEERREKLQFSPPYLTNVAVLITHDAVPELARLEDAATVFGDLQPLAFEGTLHEVRLRELRDGHHPGADLAFASANDEIIDRVAGGGYYAYVDGYNFWRAVDRGAPLRRHPVGDDPAEEFGIIMPLDSDWSIPLEQFFASGEGYLETPRYQELLIEHLGPQVARTLLEAGC